MHKVIILGQVCRTTNRIKGLKGGAIEVFKEILRDTTTITYATPGLRLMSMSHTVPATLDAGSMS